MVSVKQLDEPPQNWMNRAICAKRGEHIKAPAPRKRVVLQHAKCVVLPPWAARREERGYAGWSQTAVKGAVVEGLAVSHRPELRESQSWTEASARAVSISEHIAITASTDLILP